jgi:hypothetical protein
VGALAVELAGKATVIRIHRMSGELLPQKIAFSSTLLSWPIATVRKSARGWRHFKAEEA